MSWFPNMKDLQLKIQKNFPLSRLTTFRIGGPAKYFVEVKTPEALVAALVFSKKEKVPFMILGGGSNMLVSDSGFAGLVIVMRMKGFKTEKDTKDCAWVRVASGEVWDNTVAHFVKNKLWGAENMSLVPGTTGAAAVQNVECYGQQTEDVVESVRVYDTKTEEVKDIPKKECKFRYRRSIFNYEEKGRYIILSTLFKLKKHGKPIVTYPDVIKYFEEHKTVKPSLESLRKAIIYIRKHKLPDPKFVGNSGSFFKNVYLQENEYTKFRKKASKYFDAADMKKMEELKARFISEKGIKIPTAFLIDACKLRGSKFGGAQIHERQVLVLINATGHAKAHDVMMLVKKIRQTVYKKTGMKIFPEPELIGFTKKELAKYFALR